MSLLILILQILAILLAVAAVLLIMSILLPVRVETCEINTDKKFRGALGLWGGMLKIKIDIPLKPGLKKRLVQKIIRRLQPGGHPLRETQRDAGSTFAGIWSNLGKVNKRLPSRFWVQFFHTVKFEPWQGVITLGVENPACTGVLYGTAQSVIATRGWSDLYAQADFVGRKSRFVGNGVVKIYPAAIVFLAVKYGFKSLKLFRSKI